MEKIRSQLEFRVAWALQGGIWGTVFSFIVAPFTERDGFISLVLIVSFAIIIIGLVMLPHRLWEEKCFREEGKDFSGIGSDALLFGLLFTFFLVQSLVMTGIHYISGDVFGLILCTIYMCLYFYLFKMQWIGLHVRKLLLWIYKVQ